MEDAKAKPKPPAKPPKVEKPKPAKPPEQHEVDAKALTDIIAILTVLPSENRERVLKSVGAYFADSPTKKEW